MPGWVNSLSTNKVMEKSIIIIDEECVNDLTKRLDRLKEDIADVLKNYRLPLKGEVFMSEEEVCKRLRISRSALYVYRTQGLLSYIQLSARVIYRESDIQKLLDDNYQPSVKEFKL